MSKKPLLSKEEKTFRKKAKNLHDRLTKKGTLCDDWKDRKTFREWLRVNLVEFPDSETIFDTELFSDDGVFRPETCCYLPHEINIFLRMSGKSRSKLPKGVCIKEQKRGCIKYRARTSGYINGEWKKRVQGKGRKTPEEAHADYVILRTQSAQELARMFKDKLDPMAYEALMNYNEDERSV